MFCIVVEEIIVFHRILHRLRNDTFAWLCNIDLDKEKKAQP